MAEGTPERNSIKCQELCELAEQIGEFIQYWGFKHVHGRIWAHLYLSKEPLDAYELRTRLSISKALVSLSVRDLIHYAVIREAGKSAFGTILYEANPDIREAIFNVLRTREVKMMERISAAHKKLFMVSAEKRCESKINEDRLVALKHIIDGASSALSNLIAYNQMSPDTLSVFFGIPKVSDAKTVSESAH